VDEHRAADAASTADLRVLVEWRQLEADGRQERRTFGPLPVCHSANKTRVIHTEDNPTWHDRQMSKAAGEVA
jgi:hypothetical protein